MKETRLIINADDFGMSRGISDAVLIAHRFGILTSASLMINLPPTEYALELASRVPKLGVGIHLNLCSGKPILPPEEVPSLVDEEGSFHAPGIMIRKIWRWQASGSEIEREFCAQIRRMKDHGLHPTHADSHHHMHIYPAAARPFVRALEAEGIACARASRCTCLRRGSRAASIGGPHEGSLARRVFVQMYRAGLQRTAFRGFESPKSRISFLPHERRDLGRLGECWKATFGNLPPGTFEFACHPGFFEPGFSEADPIHLQREEELHWLTDPELRGIVERSGIRLINYNELMGLRVSRRETAEAIAS